VGTEAGLRHVAVRDTRAREADGMLGRGLHVQQGARVDVQHAFFDANHEVGVAVSDAGTRLRLSDCTIRDTVGQEADGQYGRGLAAGGGAAVELLRVAVERSREMGISVADEHTTLVGTDLTVRDTLGEIEAAQAKWGRGLAVQRGPEVRIVRGLFERNREACLFVAGADTALVLEDVTVRDTLGRASDDRFGRGLVARAGATCTVARGLFERNREVGVAAAEEGTTVTLEDVTVRDTLEASCADAGCIDAGAGTGVGSYGGAWVGARRFLLTGNAFCGIQLAHGLDEHGARAALGGTADLSEGEVSYNAVCGANVQTEGFDVARLMDDVLYHHNGLNLDMSELPVPDPGASLPEE
jgi:hypothetical protein